MRKKGHAKKTGGKRRRSGCKKQTGGGRGKEVAKREMQGANGNGTCTLREGVGDGAEGVGAWISTMWG